MKGYQPFKEFYFKKLVVKPLVKAAKMLFIVRCFVSTAMNKTSTKFLYIFLTILEILDITNVLVKQVMVDVAHMLLPVCISKLIL